VSDARNQSPDRPAWMRLSPAIAGGSLLLTLTSYVGLLTTAQALAVALATLAYLSLVIGVEYRRYGIDAPLGGER
jgi:hypothetical protein